MKISIVLCSYGRPAVLDQTVESILNQTVCPEEILIVCPSLEHVQEQTLERERVRFIASRRGLTYQRNTALDHIRDTDIVAFLDDDIELCPSYLESMTRLFQHDPDVIVASGHMLADGGRGTQVSRAAAKTLCAIAEAELRNGAPVDTKPLDYGYGCNLIVRASSARMNRFDERLALYAWLEDSDFSYHCTRGKKPPVTNFSAQCVHLGWRGSRISGRRMGYSQIINPIYLWRKARVFSLRHIVIQYWMRCLVANSVGVVWGKPEDDRLNRLKGNMTAMWHLLTGRCDPAAINQLH
ncbi:MAG TPA: glycosyltransferase family 2 protein [Terracidiphilus sp.]|jgi:glycosyltransferase involved in cell wall biosynthesis